MQELTLPTVRMIEAHGNTAVYAIESLEHGYGWTLGSVLQRALSSALPGLAITGIRIADWLPECKQLPGIKESVSELMLNWKQVRVRGQTGENHAFWLYLEAAGKQVITARDITTPDGVEIVTPDVHLATLTDEDALLSIEVLVESGAGYVPADQRAKPAPGMIAVDAIYTPIRHVSYKVEPMRVGALLSFERLVLTISTDGTIAPDDALRLCATFLQRQYTLLATFDTRLSPAPPVPSDAVPIPPQIDTLPLEALGLPLRTYNSLKRRAITRIGQVLAMTEEELRGIRNFGEQALQHVYERVVALNLLPDRCEHSDAPDTNSRLQTEPSGERRS